MITASVRFPTKNDTASVTAQTPGSRSVPGRLRAGAPPTLEPGCTSSRWSAKPSITPRKVQVSAVNPRHL